MISASLSGLIIDQESGRITLRCSAFIHEENHNWLGKIFSIAAIEQVIEVENKGDFLANLLDVQPYKSNHPHNGIRKERDDMLNTLHQIVIPEGQRPFDKIGEFAI